MVIKMKKQYELTTPKGKVVRRRLTEEQLAEKVKAGYTVNEDYEEGQTVPNREDLRAKGLKAGRFRMPRRMGRRNGPPSLVLTPKEGQQ